MNRSEYEEKMLDRLLNSGSYKKLNKDPTIKIVKEMTAAIKSSSLDNEVKEKLIPKNCVTSQIYGLPKVHKDNVPLRPIVNTIGSPPYKLAKYNAKKLRILVGHNAILCQRFFLT